MSVYEQLCQRDIDFVHAFDTMQEYVGQWAERKGFWEDEAELNEAIDDLVAGNHRTREGGDRLKGIVKRLVDSMKTALLTTEIAEHMEAIRDGGNVGCDKPGMEEFTNAEEELADLVVRVMDMARRRNMRIGLAIAAKMAVNEKRPYKHGRQC